MILVWNKTTGQLREIKLPKDNWDRFMEVVMVLTVVAGAVITIGSATGIL